MPSNDPSQEVREELYTPKIAEPSYIQFDRDTISPSNFSKYYFAAEALGGAHVENLFTPTNSLFLCAEMLNTDVLKRVWIVDADDTLWEENLHFSELIAEFCDIAIRAGATLSREEIMKIIDDLGKSALKTHGFGPIGFTAALRESWQHLRSNYGVTSDSPEELLGRVVPYLSDVPYHIRPEVHEFLDLIQDSPDEIAILFTQGHLPIQARKVARSDLAHKFVGIALGQNKEIETYRELAERLPFRSDEFIVIGNSLSHEVRPAIELGFRAFHLDNPNAWLSGTHALLDTKRYETVTSLVDAYHSIRRPD
jgi:putative hydrolase of the HAD superfamily